MAYGIRYCSGARSWLKFRPVRHNFVTYFTLDASFFLLNVRRMQKYFTDHTKDAKKILNTQKMQKNFWTQKKCKRNLKLIRSLNALQMHQKVTQHWPEMSIHANKPERDTKLNKISWNIACLWFHFMGLMTNI